jgi:hypothetical protein
VPLEPFGNNLATNQINQILVAENEEIFIATPTGLVKSNKNLTKLQYVRGKDYADKVRGLYGGAPKNWKECSKVIMEQLLPEDYVTCLSEDGNGTIWIGTRRAGFMAIDPVTGSRGTGDRASMGMADNYVSSILPMPDAVPLIGLYIGGVIKPKMELSLKNEGNSKRSTLDSRLRGNDERGVNDGNTVAKTNFAALPSPIAPPSIDELKAMQAKLQKLNKPLPKVFATYFGEDWKTQGDWVGRYGKTYAILCAMNAPYDRRMFYNENEIQVNHFIGPNTPHPDAVRHWVHWLKTDNPRTLFDPFIGTRRQAEWDDHGEGYSIHKDGPDVWYLLNVKRAGVYRLSMYFMNKDGHTGLNRIRDYVIQIYPFEQEWLGFDKWPYFAREAEKRVSKTPALAQSRIHDFWGGAYKTFVVKGPGLFAVKIDDNYSFNTIISSVMLDRMDSNEQPKPTPWVYVQYQEPELPKREMLKTPEGLAAFDVLQELNSKRDRLNVANIEKEYEWQLLRTVASAVTKSTNSEAEIQLANHLIWKVNFWNDAMRNDFKDSMAASWVKFCELHPKVVEAMKTKRTVQLRKRKIVDIWTKDKNN